MHEVPASVDHVSVSRSVYREVRTWGPGVIFGVAGAGLEHLGRLRRLAGHETSRHRSTFSEMAVERIMRVRPMSSLLLYYFVQPGRYGRVHG
jgi:hypothetical protein